MKSISLKQIVGAVILIVGIGLIALGYRNNHVSGFEKVKKQITRDHSFSEGTSRYYVSGIAFVIVGAALVVFCWQKNKKK